MSDSREPSRDDVGFTASNPVKHSGGCRSNLNEIRHRSNFLGMSSLPTIALVILNITCLVLGFSALNRADRAKEQSFKNDAEIEKLSKEIEVFRVWRSSFEKEVRQVITVISTAQSGYGRSSTDLTKGLDALQKKILELEERTGRIEKRSKALPN